jgi:hypothetical protein
MNLVDLGFTKEELQKRVVEHIAAQVMEGTFHDEDGEEFSGDSKFAKTLHEHVRKQIDASIAGLAAKYVLPNVQAYIENLTLQTTNQWGEKQGKPVTFIEYLTQRAEAYMQEEVNYEGKTKGQDSYNWRKSQTRISHLIHQHLHYSIETAMKNALATANSVIVEGLKKTVEIKLGEVAAAMKVELKTGR